MKLIEYYWDHPELQGNVRKIAEGDFLFRQGDSGQTMFILIRGIVQLVAVREGQEHIINWLQAGEFLGEKAMLKSAPHQRSFSARAKTELQVLELGLDDMSRLEERVPTLMNDILKRSFRNAVERLDLTNRTVRALRSSSNPERLVNLLEIFCETSGRKVAEGWEIPLSVGRIRYYIDMNDYEVEECLAYLVKHGLIQPISASYVLIPDPALLAEHVPALKENLPSLRSI